MAKPSDETRVISYTWGGLPLNCSGQEQFKSIKKIINKDEIIPLFGIRACEVERVDHLPREEVNVEPNSKFLSKQKVCIGIQCRPVGKNGNAIISISNQRDHYQKSKREESV